MPFLLRTDVDHDLSLAETLKNESWFKGPPITVQIISGVLTLDGHGVYKVEAESGLADDIDRINGCAEGERVELHLATAGVVITLKHGAFLKLENGQDFDLVTLYDSWEGWSHGSSILSERRRNNNPA